MFARRKISPSLQRHIYSFLIEGNLDLIYPEKKGSDKQPSSTLSIIRRVCKNSKKVTQIWQDKLTNCFGTDFEPVYLRTISSKELKNDTTMKDLMSPLFVRMNKVSPNALIEMYKHVLKECDQWTGNLVQSEIKEIKKETLVKQGLFELHELYVGLETFRRSIHLHLDDKDIPSVFVYQKQFKLRILEQIAYLLFKKSELEGHNTQRPQKQAVFNESENKLRFLCFAISTVSFLLLNIFLPDLSSSDVGVIRTLGLTGLSLFLGLFCFWLGKENVYRTQGFQRFQNNFLEEMDKRAALDLDKETENDTVPKAEFKKSA